MIMLGIIGAVILLFILTINGTIRYSTLAFTLVIMASLLVIGGQVIAHTVVAMVECSAQKERSKLKY